ncbi:response regulator [Paenibacillus sp. HB172176]|uniref:response regulator n=1 Tax=Paenibacillus sp. HB172176 TaxID=2493690 RepID=UPI00143AFA94|nr:response regulator [Paenibacillus sp. HB172176]
MAIHVLLVDDEAFDLEWLRRRVEGDKQLRLDNVQTAKSGFAALKLMEEQSIDIMITDIRMPIMSGMELARKAREISPHIQIMFISGHQDFAYAKEAIQLHAFDYLLKPVEDGELHERLAEICDRIENERKREVSYSETLSLVNQELLLRWFNEPGPGHAEEHVERLLGPMLQGGAAAAIIEIDDMPRKLQAMSDEERNAFSAQTAAFIRAFAAEELNGTVIPAYDNHFIALTSLQEDESKSLFEELITAFRESFRSYTITIGMGMRAAELAQLHASYRQAKAALSIKWMVGNNRLIQDENARSPKGNAFANMEETVNRMLQAMLEYDLVTVDDCLTQLFNEVYPLQQKNDVYELIIRINSKLHADLQQMNEHMYEILEWESHQPQVLFQFETMHDIVSWLRRRFFELSELLFVKRQKQKRGLILEITKYVKERLDQKITLNEVAAHFDFTPNYLGQLFKAETDSLFSDFVKELRMERVCELLGDPTKKIYEIAELAGYKNMIHFNRQFKQLMGMSPGEYRKKHKM